MDDLFQYAELKSDRDAARSHVIDNHSSDPQSIKSSTDSPVCLGGCDLAATALYKGAAMFRLESKLVKWKMAKTQLEAANKVNSIAKALFYFVLLLFLPGVLGALQLEGISEPFAHVLSTILTFIPKLFAAALIVFIGWLIAKLVRDILTNFLKSIGTEQLGPRFGLVKNGEETSLSTIIGNIVFILILIPTIITALEKLDLKGVSEPAIAMLQQILTLIPNIAAAIILILLGIWLGKWIEKLVEQMLWRLRFDNIFHHMGIGSLTPGQSKYTLSQLVGLLAKIVVVLLFTAEALQIVHLDFLVTLATGVIAYLPMVVAALVILGVGLYLGHLVERVLQNVLKQRTPAPSPRSRNMPSLRSRCLWR